MKPTVKTKIFKNILADALEKKVNDFLTENYITHDDLIDIKLSANIDSITVMIVYKG